MHRIAMKLAPALAVALGLMIPTPGEGQSNSDRRGGNLIYAEREAAGSLNPYGVTAARATTDRLFSMLYEELFRYNYITENYEPILAQSVQWNAGTRTASITLQSGIRWHDGRPFTADDVVFTYRYLMDRHSRPQVREYYRGLIQNVAAQGPNTVAITFRGGVAEPRQFLDVWMIPAHATGEGDGPGAGIAANPVGTGPYRFQNRNIQGNISLAVNPNHTEGRGNLDGVEMRLSSEVGTMTLQLLADIIHLVVDVPPSNIIQIESARRHRLLPYQSYTIYTFAYNSTNPNLQDHRVRRALSLAVNRSQIMEQWYDGRGELLGGPMVPAAPFYNPNLRPLPYSPAEAQRQLDDLGFTDRNGDGVRQNPSNGQPLRFRLVVPVGLQASETTEQNVARDYQEALQAIGVEVDVVNLPVDEYQRVLFQQREFDIAWVTWTFDPIYDISQQFHSDNIGPGGSNVTGYRNAEVDALLDEYARAADPGRRRSIMNTVQELIARETPYTFLFTIDRYAAIENRFTNVQIDPYYFFSYIKEWYIPPAFR